MSVLYAITNTVLFRGNFKRFSSAALRTIVPVLIAAFAVQVTFAQEQRKADNLPNKKDFQEQVQDGQSKATLAAQQKSSEPTTSTGKRNSTVVSYEVYLNNSGGYSYRITDGEKELFSQEVPSSSDSPEGNKAAAETKAKAALAAYKAKPGLTPEEYISEANYQMATRGGINQSTLALCTYTGTLQAGDPQVSGRMFRDGIPSNCIAPKVCPGPFDAAPYFYDLTTITNTTGASQCVIVNISCLTAGAQVHGSAYLGSFSAANICTNFIGDQGTSTVGAGAPVQWTFTLAAGATVVIQIVNPIGGAVTTAWSMTVDGLTCSGGPSGPITITSHPSNVTACPGTNATFSVTATPAGVSYNWQEDRGSGFVYLANGGVYSGVTTSTLTLTGITASMNGWAYRAVVTATGQLPGISNPATLTVLPALPAPIISPTTSAICPGGVQALTVLSVTSPTTNTTSSGPIVVTIPDASAVGATNTLAVAGVPGGQTISSVRVTFNITHTWDSDLDINLRAPNGQIINLVAARGGSGDNFVNTTISSASTTSLGTGAPPFTGTFAADALLGRGPTGLVSNTTQFPSLFSVPNGNWTLIMRDGAGGDLGTLTSWSIDITYGTAMQAIWTPVAGLFLDAGLTIPYVAGTPATTVYASPAATTTYTAVLNNGTCNSAGTTATVTVQQPPVITTQPSGNLTCVGSPKTFTVVATGTGLTYQWQVNPGSGFVNLTNVAPYSGVTTPTLTINPTSLALSGNQYRVIVSGTCPPPATSNAVTLTVNPLPVVTVGPTGLCSPVTLTATGADTYVWSPTAGLSPTTGAVVTATTTVNITYTVTGTVTATGCSNSATVGVVGTPTAPTLVPAAATICLGGSQLISVSGTQSFQNTTGFIIPDSGPASLYPSNITVAGLATSGVTVKSVTLAGISHTWPDDIDVVLQSPTGTNVIIMSDAGGANPITGLTYTFDDAAAATLADGALNPTGTYRPSNFGTPDTWPAPGPGSLTQATPTLSTFAGNPNGTWRLFVFDAFAGDQGAISGGWSITFNVGGSTVTFSPTTGLFTDAGLTTAYTGTPVTQVYASPAVTTTYTATSQNSGPGPLTSTSNSVGGVIIPAGAPVTTSGPGNPYPATTVVSGVAVGASVKSVQLNGLTHTFPADIDILLVSPTGQRVILMSDVGGASSITNVNYTIDDAAAVGFGGGANPTGLYRPTNSGTPDAFVAPGPGSVTQASPALSLFGNGDMNGTWNLYIVDDVGGDVGSLTSWSITFVLPIVCTSPPRTITITVNAPIVITQQPANRTACAGDNVTFTVAATGTITGYQWQVSTNGGVSYTNIAGATTPTLTLNNVTTSMNNNRYRALVSNPGCGATASNGAILTVNPLPTVSLTASPYTQLRPGMLTTLSVSSTPAGASYIWSVNGSVVSSITGATYVADAYHLGTYSVLVTDVNGCRSTTNSVTLTALPSSNLFIYPNPSATGVFFVTYYTPQINWPVTINVIDMKGRRLETRSAVTTAPYTRFDFSSLKLGAGVYVIEFRNPSGDRLAAGRLVVIR